MMGTNDHANPPSREVGRWTTAGVALIACALAGAGIVALFRTDNELGTTAALVSGLILGFTALTGRLPRRLSIAGHQIDLIQEAAEVSADVVADAAENAAQKTDDPKKVAAAARDAQVSIKRLYVDAAILQDQANQAAFRRLIKMIKALNSSDTNRTG